jgi:Protein of unknown function (DUF3662)/FHA domain
MGVLDRFEKGIERAVNGAFAKAFRSEVQPVEIASALRRECDDRAAIVGRDRTVVPNTFVVELGPADHARLGQWADALGDELGAVVVDHARSQHYGFVGPVGISFEQADDLDTGLFRVRSTTVRGERDEKPVASQLPDPSPAVRPVPGAVAPASAVPVAVPPPAVPVPTDGPTTFPVPPGPPAVFVQGHRYELTGEVAVIGRGAEADVVVDDAGVSRRHAELHLKDGKARVVDLGSTNGTYVNGERISVAELTDGATITVGRSHVVYRAPGDGAGR